MERVHSVQSSFSCLKGSPYDINLVKVCWGLLQTLERQKLITTNTRQTNEITNASLSYIVMLCFTFVLSNACHF